jgi:hypothetical protein
MKNSPKKQAISPFNMYAAPVMRIMFCPVNQAGAAMKRNSRSEPITVL